MGFRETGNDCMNYIWAVVLSFAGDPPDQEKIDKLRSAEVRGRFGEIMNPYLQDENTRFSQLQRVAIFEFANRRHLRGQRSLSNDRLGKALFEALFKDEGFREKMHEMVTFCESLAIPVKVEAVMDNRFYPVDPETWQLSPSDPDYGPYLRYAPSWDNLHNPLRQAAIPDGNDIDEMFRRRASRWVGEKTAYEEVIKEKVDTEGKSRKAKEKFGHVMRCLYPWRRKKGNKKPERKMRAGKTYGCSGSSDIGGISPQIPYRV